MTAAPALKSRRAAEAAPADTFAVPDLAGLETLRARLEQQLRTLDAVPRRIAELRAERNAAATLLRDAEEKQAAAFLHKKVDADAMKDAAEASARLKSVEGALRAAGDAERTLRAEIGGSAEELSAALGAALAGAKAAADRAAENAMRTLTGAVMLRAALDMRWAAKPALALDGTTDSELNRLPPADDAQEAISKLASWRQLVDRATREAAAVK